MSGIAGIASQSLAEKVAKAAAKMPAAPVSEIAAKAGVSISTARHHLAVLRVTDAS